MLARYAAGGRDLLRNEVDWIRAFLIELKTKPKLEETENVSDTKQQKVNLVKLTGIIKKIMTKDDSGFILVDPETDDSRFIACTVYKQKDLAAKLATFQEDDYIQIQGMIRAWSKKLDGGGYENRVEVRITYINNTGTAATNKKKAAPVQDDELPW